MKFLHLAAAILCATFGSVLGDEKAPDAKELAAFQKVMKTIAELQYQTGEIKLLGGKAKITLTDEFQFLDPANAARCLWTSGTIHPKSRAPRA